MIVIHNSIKPQEIIDLNLSLKDKILKIRNLSKVSPGTAELMALLIEDFIKAYNDESSELIISISSNGKRKIFTKEKDFSILLMLKGITFYSNSKLSYDYNHSILLKEIINSLINHELAKYKDNSDK